MHRLPFTVTFALAASALLLLLSAAGLAGAAFSRQTDLILLSAAVFTIVAAASAVLVGQQVAKLLRETKKPYRVLAVETPRSRPKQDASASPAPAVSNPSDDEPDLRRLQKLEAFEHLRDGIVHDLNNKLMVISANIDSVARHLKDQPALQRKLLSALVASDQAAGLIARAATFARQPQAQVRHIDLADRIGSVAALMSRSLLRDTVELRLSVEDGLWPVEVDQDDLETAIVSLSAYARDALTQGGAITLEARNVQVERGSLTDLTLGGDFVQLVIGGAGGEEAISGGESGQERAFTLRDIDLSAWLRLSRSLHFLKPLGGAAEVRNTDTGTAIILYLPRAKAVTSLGSRLPHEEAAESGAVRRDTEILVVDDEVEVALALQSMLEESGYVTRVATNAGQVMKGLQVRTPDLVLTDVSMPGTMNGIVLAREIRQAFPALPILLITGNPAVEGEGDYPLLQKPIVSRDLHAAIQRHLKPPEENKVVPLFPRASRQGS
ncbi:response regulator [Microvirga sp. GCM10011540]|uniref:response regulator n=1 Tax=Microvirga sp. GCM10011540 TaxID=3317338 RepID=UPI0036170CB6